MSIFVVVAGCPGKIHGIEVSTSHFTGNYPPQFSLSGASLPHKLSPRTGDRIGTHAPADELASAEKLQSEVCCPVPFKFIPGRDIC